MSELKPYGAFVEYTCRPLIEECKEMLTMFDERGIKLNKDLFKALILAHFSHVLIDFIKTLLIGAMICLTVYLTFRS